MSIQIRIIQGKNTSIHTIEKRFVPVGMASHCELNLSHPDIPDVACLLECDFVGKTILVNCLHSNLVVLNNKPLNQNDKILWHEGQEMQIGANCRLIHGTGPASAGARPKPASASLPQSQKRAETANNRPQTPRASQSRGGNTPTASRANADVAEQEQQAARKKQSQLIQIILIVLCVAGCAMMLLVDTTPSVGKKEKIEFSILDPLLLEKGKNHNGLYENARSKLNKARTAQTRREAHRLYMELKTEVELRRQNSPDTELDQKIIDYINQQL